MGRSVISVPKRQERNSFISGMIAGEMRRMGKENDEMARKSGMVERTFRNKIDNPEAFTLKELYDVADALEIKIVFVRKQQPC